MTNFVKLPGKVSVIMPAYNEAEHILKNLAETVETFNDFGIDFEIIVVDDGSPDHTWLIASKELHLYKNNVRIVRYHANQGKGNALMCGTWHATGDYIVFLDADMDLHPLQLPAFFGIMEAQNVDIVVGSKLHPLSQVNYPWIRRLWSFGYYSLVRILFGLPLRDTQTGLKLFKAEVLRRVFPKVLVKRFAFDIEVLAIAHHLGYQVAEAPVTLSFTRRFGRIALPDVLNIFTETLAIYYRLYVRRYYDTIRFEWHAPEYDQDVEIRVGQAEYPRVPSKAL